MKAKDQLLRIIILGFALVIPLTVTAEYGDILMNQSAPEMRKSKVDDVVFPHWFHRIRFKCKACHEKIFVMQAGQNKTDMKKMGAGESCGTCHNDIIAFGTDACETCHAVSPAQAAAQPAQTAEPAKKK